MPSIRLPCPSTTDRHFGRLFFPGVQVGVKLGDGTFQSFEFILDSGADCTMVPCGMARLTGFSLPRTPDTHVSGISGRPIAAYIGNLTLKIQSEIFDVRCLFTRSNRTPLLLGRVDFFSLFSVTFDGRNSHIILDKIT